MDSQKQRLPERDTLGWLAQSSVVPQKRKEIEGVTSSSIVNLQAQLFRTQENVRQRKDGTVDVNDRHVRRKAGIDVSKIFSRQNAGVEARDQKDRLHIKTVDEKGAEVYAALERKAALYDKLARGEVDDEGEAYEVDFLKKGTLVEEAQGMQAADGSDYHEPVDTSLKAVEGTGGMESADMARERERRRWESEASDRMHEEWEHQERRRAHKETIQDLEEQTREGRERAQRAKDRKEETVAARREKLKSDFMRKHMERLLASGRGGGKGGGASSSKPGK